MDVDSNVHKSSQKWLQNCCSERCHGHKRLLKNCSDRLAWPGSGCGDGHLGALPSSVMFLVGKVPLSVPIIWVGAVSF